jgi:hypothetical protein
MIQPEPLERLMGDMHMPCMGRVERPAQKPDHLTRARDGKTGFHPVF